MGRPATVAYPMPFGMTTAAVVSPATTSERSHSLRSCGSHSSRDTGELTIASRGTRIEERQAGRVVKSPTPQVSAIRAARLRCVSCRDVIVNYVCGYLTISLIVASIAGYAGAASAHGDDHAEHPLGVVDFPISCSDEARSEFDHAVALLHHMTYPQAREGFRQVAATDPHCAMAHWGIAMTLFQPLWPTRPGPQALQQGWD